MAAGLQQKQLNTHIEGKGSERGSRVRISPSPLDTWKKGSKDKNPYLENRILKIILKYQRLKSWFVRTNRIEEDKREDIQNKQKRNEDFK